MLANIITVVGSGNILMVNNAAAKLLGYSKKALITKNRSDIFDIDDSNFKKMLKQRAEAGQSLATITAIKKTGKQFPCEISSALITGEDGIEKAISTLVDLTKKIKNQQIIDDKREEVVLNNIDLANAKQFKIDSICLDAKAKNFCQTIAYINFTGNNIPIPHYIVRSFRYVFYPRVVLSKLCI